MSATSAFPSSVAHILVTGASRGIGLEFVRQYSLKPNTHIIATCRKPSQAEPLQLLAKQRSNITIAELDVSSDASISSFVSSSPVISLPHLSLLLNNAGIASAGHPNNSTLSATREDLLHLYSTNTVGPLLLTNALLFLLRKSKTNSDLGTAKVVNVSSNLGSIANNTFGGMPGYRCSKAALNMWTHSASIEERNVWFLSVHPGWVQTDMGNSAGRSAPVQVDDSVKGLINAIEKLDEKTNGGFLSFTGETLSW